MHKNLNTSDLPSFLGISFQYDTDTFLSFAYHLEVGYKIMLGKISNYKNVNGFDNINISYHNSEMLDLLSGFYFNIKFSGLRFKI